jgi:hypothetical protein
MKTKCYATRLSMGRVLSRRSGRDILADGSSPSADKKHKVSASSKQSEFQNLRFGSLFWLHTSGDTRDHGVIGGVIRAWWGSPPKEHKGFIEGQLVSIEDPTGIH